MSLDPRADEIRQLEHVKQDLLREFATLPVTLVDEAFALVVSRYNQAPVRSFVPVLAQRETRTRLRQLA